jgi:DNA-binding PadR family transcriptional regulator
VPAVKKDALGMNEALILSALEHRPQSSIANVARVLEAAQFGRSIDDGTIYMTMRRMLERGFVTQQRRVVVSVDLRSREIGFYSITRAGIRAAKRFAHEASALERLSAVSESR